MTTEEAIQLLELTAPFSKAALKKAYREAQMIWHPDRFAENTDLRSKAEKRTGLINEAYELLNRLPESGFPYESSPNKRQEKQPQPTSAKSASHNPSPQQQPSQSSSSQRAAAEVRQPDPANRTRKKTDFLTIAAWVICVPSAVFLIAFFNQIRSSTKTAALGSDASNQKQSVRNTGSSKSNFEEIRTRAQQGDKEAQYQIGKVYLLGSDRVSIDHNEAAKWFRYAAEQGYAIAQLELGERFAYGEGVPHDPASAVIWYCKAAEQKFPEAQYELGFCFEYGMLNLPKNEEEAVRWYRRAADQGYAIAQSTLGFCYGDGTGVVKDETEAATWYRKAADQGDPSGQTHLGTCYMKGRGVKKDEAEAFKWYQKAAEQSDDRGMFHLGACFQNGTGVDKNAAEAVKWYRKVCDQGKTRGWVPATGEAQFSLGVCYADGDGVPKDLVLSHMWLSIAAARGVNKAEMKLPHIETNMTEAQIVEAKSLAAKILVKKRTQEFKKSPLAGTGSLPSENAKQILPPNGQSQLEAFEASEARAIREYPALTDESSELYAAVSARCDEIVSWKDAGLHLPLAMIDGNVVTLDPDNPNFPYLVAREQSAKLGDRKPSAATMPIEDKQLRHLASDDRPADGIFIDRLKQAGGKGHLKLINGLMEDAYVKMIHNEKLVAAFYVRGGDSFTFTHVPDGIYKLIYCTGFGWDGGRRDFSRGRHAVRYDELLDFATTRRTEGNTIITSTAVITLTLHKIANGNTSTSDIPLEEFDRY